MIVGERRGRRRSTPATRRCSRRSRGPPSSPWRARRRQVVDHELERARVDDLEVVARRGGGVAVAVPRARRRPAPGSPPAAGAAEAAALPPSGSPIGAPTVRQGRRAAAAAGAAASATSGEEEDEAERGAPTIGSDMVVHLVGGTGLGSAAALRRRASRSVRARPATARSGLSRNAPCRAFRRAVSCGPCDSRSSPRWSPCSPRPATRLPGGRRLAVRAQVGRLPGARVPRRRRALHPEPRPQAARPLLPRARRAAEGPAARALRARRRGRDRPRRRARSSRRSCCGSTRRRRGCGCWPRSRRRRSSPGTCWRSATRTCGPSRRASGGPASRRCWAAPTPPVHLTPATRDRALAADWFDRFEGAGLDGVVAKRLDGAYQPGKRAMLKIKHERTADCVVAGFRWHKNGPGTHVGSPAARAVRRRGHAPPRRDHVVVHVGQAAPRSSTELAPLREGALEGHPWGEWAEWASAGRGRRVRPAAARRDVALEPRQGPVVGAAAGRARRRGRLRPPPGRPVPARDDVPPLAPGQAARRLPLRPARDHRPVRARARSSAAPRSRAPSPGTGAAPRRSP